MISAFENMVRQNPSRMFFTDIEDAGRETAYSYREVRMYAAALAKCFRDRGARQGDCIAVDLRNGVAFVCLLLAAAYGGYTLILQDEHLTEGRKLSLLAGLERDRRVRIAARVDEHNVGALMDALEFYFDGGMNGGMGRTRTHSTRLDRQERVARPSFVTKTRMETAEVRTSKGLGRAGGGRESLARREEMARQDALENAINFADHATHMFDQDAHAVIMLVADTKGRAKAVPLTWRNLTGAAQASNAALGRRGEGIWQAALPLSHINGLQVVVRSILNGTPFLLYRSFDANKVLADVVRRNATHIAVTTPMLQALCDSERSAALGRYSCVLVDGMADLKVLEQAWERQTRAYVSYGMVETAGQVACALIDLNYRGGLKLLSGYQAHVVDPGADGFGRLAVRGPGLFAEYLNGHVALTVDGFFLTGDVAAIHNGLLYVKARTDDMFVSGGGSVYPEEIRKRLLGMPGVADAQVIGVSVKDQGRCPVAFVERAPLRTGAAAVGKAGDRAAEAAKTRAAELSNHRFAAEIRSLAAQGVPESQVPQRVCVVDALPRTAKGTIDRQALSQRYDNRIQVEKVTIYRVRPSQGRASQSTAVRSGLHDTLVIEVTDRQGRTGLGEMTVSGDVRALGSVDQCIELIREVLAPVVLNEVFLHPSEASDAFASYSRAVQHPHACGAVEPALWDLYGKIVGMPLWQLIGGSSDGSAPASARVRASQPAAAVEAARACVHAGSRRIVLEVRPTTAYACASAVQEALPQVDLILDAGQCFTETDMDELRTLDSVRARMIVDPLDPRRSPLTAHGDVFERLACLQRSLRTPIGVDRAIALPKDVIRAMRQRDLKCIALNIGRMGGIQPALEFVRLCRERGMAVWVSDACGTGISKRFHAAFETVDGVAPMGDIGVFGSEDLAADMAGGLTLPPYTVERGAVALNRIGFKAGLGCMLNKAALSRVLVQSETMVG